MCSLYLTLKNYNNMYGSLDGKVNSSSAGQYGQLDCGEDWVFVSAGQLSLSQKVFRGQIKWQLQTQKAALYCIVLLSEWLQTTQLHSNLFHISCSNARVRSQTWSLQKCFPFFPNLCAAKMQIFPNAVCQNLQTESTVFALLWPFPLLANTAAVTQSS